MAPELSSTAPARTVNAYSGAPPRATETWKSGAGRFHSLHTTIARPPPAEAACAGETNRSLENLAGDSSTPKLQPAPARPTLSSALSS